MASKGPSVHVVYDVTGKRYTVSVKASETHTSLSQITNGTLRKNMAAFVKVPLAALELYDKARGGAAVTDGDFVPVGATLNLRLVDKDDDGGEEGERTEAAASAIGSSRGGQRGSSAGTRERQQPAAADRRLAEDPPQQQQQQHRRHSATGSSAHSQHQQQYPQRRAPSADLGSSGDESERAYGGQGHRQPQQNAYNGGQRPPLAAAAPPRHLQQRGEYASHPSDNHFGGGDGGFGRHSDPYRGADEDGHHWDGRNNREVGDYNYSEERGRSGGRQQSSASFRGEDAHSHKQHQHQQQQASSSAPAHNTSNISAGGARMLAAEVGALIGRGGHDFASAAALVGRGGEGGGATAAASDYLHPRSGFGAHQQQPLQQPRRSASASYRTDESDDEALSQAHSRRQQQQQQQQRQRSASGGGDGGYGHGLVYRRSASGGPHNNNNTDGGYGDAEGEETYGFGSVPRGGSIGGHRVIASFNVNTAAASAEEEDDRASRGGVGRGGLGASGLPPNPTAPTRGASRVPLGPFGTTSVAGVAGGGDAEEETEQLRRRCDELTAMKDTLASELQTLSARLNSSQNHSRAPSANPSGAAPVAQTAQSSAAGTPSRDRFAAPPMAPLHFPLNSSSANNTPATHSHNVSWSAQQHQTIATNNNNNASINTASQGAGTTASSAKATATAAEAARLQQQIATLKALAAEDASNHSAEERALMAAIRDAKAAAEADLSARIKAQRAANRRHAEALSAAEASHAGTKRYADSCEAEAEEHRRMVDGSTAQLDAAKARIVRILSEHHGGGGAGGEGSTTAEELAQAITAAAAQRSKAAILLEQCGADNEALRRGLDDLSLKRKLLHNELEDAKGNIRVVVRLRPELRSDALAPHSLGSVEEGSLEVSEERKCAYVTTPTAGSRCYEFYDVYGPARDSLAQQGELFEAQVQPLLNSVFDGYNVAVLAYGQTGSGKTFTIIGETADGTLSGLLPQSIEYLLADAQGRRARFPTTITMTMVELYMDTVYDLLHVYDPNGQGQGQGGLGDGPRPDSARGGMDRNRRCELRQLPGADGVTVVGAVEVILDSWAQAMQIIHTGITERQTHKTLKNAFSSRSHMVLTVNVEVERPNGGVGGGPSLQRSKLVFSDLAGSERVSRSLSQGDRLKEAQHINKSLSALGDVLHALSASPRPQHIPYRNSKLTQLLQSTIGGNSKTLMVACVSPHLPAHHNLVETQSTLQFASRARLIRNTFTNGRK